MDSVTQFLLGASISGALLGPRIGAKSLLIGGLVATLPDLDSFIPYDDPITSMTHHRGFSHSLIVQTIISPVIAIIVGKIVPSTAAHRKLLFLTVWLALITHSLLDSLTTYGTQLFWPLSTSPPAALPSVFIIDPFYTLLLLAGVLTIFFARKRPGRGLKTNGILLALATGYLAVGVMSHFVIAARAATDPQLAGMRIHVQPTPLNLLIWQVTAISDDRFSTGLTSLVQDCPIRDLITADRHAMPEGLDTVPPPVERLEWFTDGFYTYGTSGDALTVTDLRIGYYPSYAFSFKFAAEEGGKITPINPERIPISYEKRAGDLFGQMAKTLRGC
ncbi:metal-dependent hydrolase [Sneathiella sp.]|uniref:metal-dependent hydrolase n=1 Tax=Sneathiella sp. TaxID=1964365 RepID=UPI0035630C24